MACVARYGISGLTLDKVAELARLARPLIRHNIGNRQQLIDAVTDHFIANSNAKMSELDGYLPEDAPLSAALDYLFETDNTDTTLMLVAEALIAESANSNRIAGVMRDWLENFVARLSALAAREFPAASQAQCSIVATGITGIYFTVDSMSPIYGLTEFSSNAKKSALLLLEQLR